MFKLLMFTFSLQKLVCISHLQHISSRLALSCIAVPNGGKRSDPALASPYI